MGKLNLPQGFHAPFKSPRSYGCWRGPTKLCYQHPEALGSRNTGPSLQVWQPRRAKRAGLVSSTALSGLASLNKSRIYGASALAVACRVRLLIAKPLQAKPKATASQTQRENPFRSWSQPPLLAFWERLCGQHAPSAPPTKTSRASL